MSATYAKLFPNYILFPLSSLGLDFITQPKWDGSISAVKAIILEDVRIYDILV